MTEQELKALAFDEVQKRDMAANNLQVILQQLQNLTERKNGTKEKDRNKK